jgi:regulator of extracellular matrix RemA (YlzA/DUF370 family)
MSLIHIGGGSFINDSRLIAAVPPDSAPVKRVIGDARERSMLIDASCGKRTKSVLIMDSGHAVLSFKSAEKIFGETLDTTDMAD